MVYIMEQY